jgi:predicted nucleic acid-binding protein
MITYSLDTNLVIPLINESDHNRHIILSIIKSEKNKCVICSSVIEEVKKILRDKTALAIEKSLKILFPLKDIKEPFQRNKFLIESFQELMNNDENLNQIRARNP